MSIKIGGFNNWAEGYGVNHLPEKVVPTSEVTYVSLVKRVGLDWKIEMHEHSDKSRHLNYIESLRGNPNVEEAKVLEFNKIAEVINMKVPSTIKSGLPIINEIKLR